MVLWQTLLGRLQKDKYALGLFHRVGRKFSNQILGHSEGMVDRYTLEPHIFR